MSGRNVQAYRQDVWPDLRAFESGSILGLGVDGIYICVVFEGDPLGCTSMGVVDGGSLMGQPSQRMSL